MVVQSLESRRLLSFAVVGGVLTVTGTDDADVISLKRVTDQIRLSDNGVIKKIPLASVTSIQVLAGAGNDSISLNSTILAPATLSGEAGNDALIGGGANDSLNGGPGNDTLAGGAGADVLIGGKGGDTANYGDRTKAITVTIDAVANDGQTAENDNVDPTTENVIGGAGNDNISGNKTPNLFDGGAGNDTLSGVKGDDTLDGGTGADNLSGGSGLDTVTYASRANNVTVKLGEQPDFSGNGEAGENDIILPNIETLIGGSGNDILDAFFSLAPLPSLLIDGGPGNDALGGNEGNDTLLGGPGNDTLGRDAGNDSVDGGEGVDLYNLHNVNEPGGGANVSLDNVANDGFAGETDNVLDTIENLVGSLGDDTLTGTSANNIIEGFRGQDSIDGGGGDDLLTVFRNLASSGGGGTLSGGDGNDTLGGTDKSSTFNEIHGGPGDDLIFADNSTILMTGDAGNDFLNFNLRTFGGTFDLSAAAFETIQGSNGADHFIGGPGDEVFLGLKGDDTIEAGAGNDYLDGGIGDDSLLGGDGNDVFVNNEGIAPEGNHDVVDGGADFDGAQDGGFSLGNNPTPLDTLSNIDLVYDPAGGVGAPPLSANAKRFVALAVVAAEPAPIPLGGAVVNGTLKIVGTSKADAISVILNKAGTQISVTENDVSATFTLKSVKRIFIDTGAGNDVISLAKGDGTRAVTRRTTVLGGKGNDSITGGADGDSLAGGDGNDTLVGAAGNDYLNGGGDKLTFASDGADFLGGGPGNDSVVYSMRQDNLSIDIANGSKSNDGAKSEGDNVQPDIENVFAGNGNDSVVGNAAANLISGSGGNDTITAGDGSDKLIGGRDADRLLGQAGINLFSMADTVEDDFDASVPVPGGTSIGAFISGDKNVDFSIPSNQTL